MKLSSITILLVGFTCPVILYASENTIVFEGRYEFRTDKESVDMLGSQVCFFPSKPSSKNVPRPTGDNRLPWFCFENSKQAAHLLGFEMNAQAKACGVTGAAKVQVSGYKRYAGEGDDNDVATLNSVLEKSKPGPLSCSE